MRKLLVVATVLLMAAVSAVAPVDAAGRPGSPPLDQIDLPEGFFPEGIVRGRGTTFYVGSLSDGSIYRGDIRTGEGEVLTEEVGGFSTIGLTFDRKGRVWAAGGISGTARAYDGRTGELLASYELTGPLESFINDAVVTSHGVWFTDSGTQNDPDPDNFQFAGSPRLFLVPFGPGGRLPDPSKVAEIAVDIPDVAFPNLNGIVTAPGGRGFVIAHTVLGALFHADPRTGEATQIDIGATLVGPDGLERRGRTVYVVENAAVQVAVVRLDRGATSGTVVDALPVVGAESPTTVAFFGRDLWAVDARFQSMAGPYRIYRVPVR